MKYSYLYSYSGFVYSPQPCCGDDHMWRGLLPIIMLPNGDFLLRCTCMLFWFWILTTWGSVQIEETVVGWRNPLRMKTSALYTVLHTCNYVPFTFTSRIWWLAAVNCNCITVYHHLIRQDLTSESMTHDHHQRKSNRDQMSQLDLPEHVMCAKLIEIETLWLRAVGYNLSSTISP